MKKYFVALFILFTAIALQAQSPAIEFKLQAGLSTPLFDYASKYPEKSPLAMPGFTASAEISMTTANKWGGSIQAGLQLHPIDVSQLGYAKVTADPFLEDLYIRSEPFRVIHLMAGPSRQWQLSGKLTMDANLAGGVFFSSTPYQLYKPKYYMAASQWYEITSSGDVSFAWGAGAGLTYRITPWYQIGFNNQLMNSRASFKFYTGAGERTDVRNITFLNTAFSLIIKILPLKESGS